MSEAFVALQSDLVEEVAASPAARFYVVSKRKLTILFVATFGLYGVYWQYKLWSRFKHAAPSDSEDAGMWPVMRAIFGVFFIHPLFGQVKRHSKDAAALAEWKAGAHQIPHPTLAHSLGRRIPFDLAPAGADSSTMPGVRSPCSLTLKVISSSRRKACTSTVSPTL